MKTFTIHASWRKYAIRVNAINAYEAMLVCERLALDQPNSAGLAPFVLFMHNAAQQDIGAGCRRYTHRDGKSHVDVKEV